MAKYSREKMSKKLLQIANINGLKEFHDELHCAYGEVIAEICEKFEVKIQLPNKNDKDYQIEIIGVPNAVKSARQELQDVISSLNVVGDFTVPYLLREHFLRDNAQKLRCLEKKFYGISIALSAPGISPAIARIKGPKVNIEKVVEELKEIILSLKEDLIEAGGPILVNPHVAARAYFSDKVGIVTEVVKKIHPDNYWMLTWNEKNFLYNLMQEYSVNIVLPTLRRRKRYIEVTGFWENVSAVRFLMIKKIDVTKYQAGWKKFEIRTEFDKDYIGLAIGKKGHNIQRISKDYDVGITFLSRGEPQGMVRIYGDEAKVQAVMTELTEMIEGAEPGPKSQRKAILKAKVKEGWNAVQDINNSIENNSTIKVYLTFDNEFHRMLLGAYGKSLLQYCHAAGMKLKLPERSESYQNRLYLIGPESAIKSLGKYLKYFLKCFQDTKRIYMSIPVVDKVLLNEDIFAGIHSRYEGVSLTIQDSGWPYVQIASSADFIDDVKEAIEEIVEKMEEESDIPTDLEEFGIGSAKEPNMLEVEKCTLPHRIAFSWPAYLITDSKVHQRKIFQFCLDAETAYQYSGKKMLKPLPEDTQEIPRVEDREFSILTLSEYARSVIKNCARRRANRVQTAVSESAFPYVSKSTVLQPHIVNILKICRREMEVNTGVSSITLHPKKYKAVVTGRNENVDSCIGHIINLSKNHYERIYGRLRDFTQQGRLKQIVVDHPNFEPGDSQMGKSERFYDDSLKEQESSKCDDGRFGDSTCCILKIKGRKISRALKNLGSRASYVSRFDIKDAMGYKPTCKRYSDFSRKAAKHMTSCSCSKQHNFAYGRMKEKKNNIKRLRDEKILLLSDFNILCDPVE